MAIFVFVESLRQWLHVSGCPVTWKTWKCQGISMQGEKVVDFCCVKFIFSQSEHPDFEIFLGRGEGGGEHALTVLDTHENLIVVWKSQGKVREKSGKSQGSSSFLETGHPDVYKVWFIYCVPKATGGLSWWKLQTHGDLICQLNISYLLKMDILSRIFRLSNWYDLFKDVSLDIFLDKVHETWKLHVSV